MSDMKLVGLCGSLRTESSNRKLMFEAARLFAPGAFTELDLRFPLFDEDIQNADGIPAIVQQAADQIAAADAVLVVTPEYNKGISGVLKNALDWISRTEGAPWKDKPVALLSSAAGRAGGERAQNMARLCLTPFRPRLLTGPEMMLAQSRTQFDDDGRLSDARGRALLLSLMEELRTEAERMRG
ncbi:NAD(P)H-dependent FMN reductase [Antarctobacter heliothermus]|uniref:NAD(P)H-dependent FMN reductase n=1 Tax=Antarctobacter heliothermus TaxID=74033 RepID=A0A222DZW2_9RHOB|nr:NADPH-dependent FMN reductase [Antarctobacter heliothermus]ASP19525.1 NAD(P)H-dependent FMN reductase [Antarctobacter heliothermus]